LARLAHRPLLRRNADGFDHRGKPKVRWPELSANAGMGIIDSMAESSVAPATLATGTLGEWFATPLGRYLLERERAYFEQTLADIFGFHALQIGLPEYPLLKASRITIRLTVDLEEPAQVLADPHWLPFAENGIDLVILPHTLEFTDEPHQLLREIHRVIRPEGQLIIAGFNPYSLFGVKRYFGREQTMPWTGNFISLYRLKDWLSLLGFEVAGGRLDCYVPPFRQERWLQRFHFFERAGDRWWPIAGGVYFLRATKRILGMRVITPAWSRRVRKKALASAARQVRECADLRE
jgi:SAM-dependent methyltransferase